MENKVYTYIYNDIYSNVLQLSENPSQFAEYLTLQIREILGTRTVIIAIKTEKGDSEIFSVYPPRRTEWANQSSILKLASISFDFEGVRYLSNYNKKEKTAILLNELEVEKAIAIPLIAANRLIGSILLLDIMDLFGIEAVIELLNRLSGVFALIIRNAQLYHNMETLVFRRTQELQKQNEELVKSQEQLKRINEEHQALNEELSENINKTEDINQKLIEANLRAEKSELQAKDILETAMDGFWIVNQKGRFVNVNESACKMLGYSQSEMLRMHISDIEFYESPEHVNNRLKKIAKEGEDRFESKHRCKDGTIIDVVVNVKLQPSQDLYVVFVSDITENKKAEDDLLRNQYYLSKAQEMGKIGTWELDLIKNNLIWTEEAYKIFGVPFGQKMNYEKFLIIVHHDDRDLVNTKWNNAVHNNEPYEIEHRLLINDEVKWVRQKAEISFDSKGIAIKAIGFTQDITFQKETETELFIAKSTVEESEERFKLAMNASKDGLFDWDLVTNEIYYSPGWKSMLGYTDDELPNDFSVWENTTEPEDVKRSWELQQKLISKEVDRFELEFKMKHKNGHWVDILSRAEAVFDDKGKAIRIVGTHVNITERKQSELLTSENELRLRLSMNAAKAGSWIWDIETDEVFWDDRMQEIFGFVPGSFDGNYESWKKRIHPDDVEEADRKTVEAIKNGTDYDFEYRLNIEHEVGRWRNVRAQAIVISNEDGERIRMAGFCEDISEKKKADEKSRATEENLKNTFDLSPSIISKANIESGYFIEANNAVTRILGYSIEEFTSRPINEFIHPEDRQRTIDEITEQLKGKEVTSFENRYLCKDGSYKWMAWDGTKADKNGIVTAIGSDINERKKAVEALQKSKNLLTETGSMAKVGGWEIDLKGNTLAWTEETYNIHELSSDNKPDVAQAINFYHPDDRDMVASAVEKAVANGEPFDFEARLITNKGNKIWVRASGKTISKKGEISGIQGSIQDITQRKLIEIELVKAKDEAELSDRLKSAFLANMSHEIRTPMNGILGFVNLINTPNLQKEQINKYSSIISKSSKRLLNTINDIIDISKIEAGEIVISNTTTSVIKLMDELYSFHHPEANLKGLSLSLIPSDSIDDIEVITDSNKLHGILTNLIKNAIKYTNKGSIAFGCEVKGSFIEFYVEDSGIGIPEDRIKAVFNRFEQADIEDTRVLEGSGLGLAISKAYVEILGGEISVESVVGVGSKFVFTIPFIEDEKEGTEQLSKKGNKDNKSIKKLKLLIVEDEEVSSELLVSILEDLFEEIIVVNNGKDAIKICKDKPELDLVLMDIKMPIMNGYDATRQIRKFNKKLVIIAQTAFALVGDENKALDSGCNAYLSKPIQRDKLLDLIGKFFEKS